MEYIIWLLLPVAALSGWLSARKHYRLASMSASRPDMKSYYKGLNHLLNEQPDQAMDVFVSILEVDNETVELHLALGNMFRRRGEVDRAIMLHQNLIARPTLTAEQKDRALLELGQDFFKSGLLDRAERLFDEVKQSRLCGAEALKYLKEVYQQESEWEKAIATAQQLEKQAGHSMASEIAQYYCELAEQCYHLANRTQANKWLKKALSQDGDCVRAYLLQGRMEQDLDNYTSAARAYSAVLQKDPDFAPLVLENLAVCYESMQQGKRNLPRLFEDMIGKQRGRGGILALSNLISRQQSSVDAHVFLKQQLNVRPSIKLLKQYLQYLPKDKQLEEKNRELVSEVVGILANDGLDYRCNQCGYGSTKLYWQCPSCQSWSSVKPV